MSNTVRNAASGDSWPSQPLDELRSALQADGYDLKVEAEATGLLVTVTAGEKACADCLVPKPLMLNILRDRLGPTAPSIRLVYPAGSTA